MSRTSLLTVAAALVASGLVLAQGRAAQPAAVDRYDLPAGITFPEGVAYDPVSRSAYTASAVTGLVARVDLTTKAATTVAAAGVLLPASPAAPFPAVLGMKLDTSGRLWIAGGVTGRMWLLDTKTGRVLKALQVPNPSASLINDVALVGTAGYFTDTRAPILWRVNAPAAGIGDVEPWLNFGSTVLQYDAGNNLNGIAATPDGRSLVVVQMTKGLLFKIDVATKTVVAIDTAGADLSGADGLVLDGQTLYVVRQTANEIATVRLTADLARGSVVNRFKDGIFDYPATAAQVGNELIVVNTQFDRQGNKTERTPFALLRVPLARLAGQ